MLIERIESAVLCGTWIRIASMGDGWGQCVGRVGYSHISVPGMRWGSQGGLVDVSTHGCSRWGRTLLNQG